ncbi:MAG: hypothetical protein C0617_07290 [Desulfuromonas sp.]|uniref:hypothetical protein n=1 Tax=Desulfuromonas sp. TaxID=892 RepID=UPI000CB54BC7|nr:hypothetical protein [Desulfuromonas sp.]PLX84636.1 MAG: hypothetical protein C0617_07290 [Desulfuromonas sp.]
MAKKYRRRTRNFFIKKDMQGKLLYQHFLMTILGVIVFALIFSLLSADNLTITYENQHIRIGQTPLILLKEMLKAHWIFLMTVGLLVLAMNLILYHRFAGPAYRFEMTFGGMVSKDLDQHIYLRSKDMMKELAEQINTFNQDLSDEMRTIRRHCEAVEDRLDRLEPDTKNAQATEMLNQAREENRQIQNLLAAYKLKSADK